MTKDFNKIGLVLKPSKIDDLSNFLDWEVNQATKDFQDLEYSFEQLMLYGNNWYLWERQLGWFAWADENKMESEAYIFSKKLEEYLYKYSNQYRQSITDYSNTILWDSWEVITWAREWVVEWTKDYIMNYHDTFKSLRDLSLVNIKSWVKWLLSYARDPIWSVAAAAVYIKEQESYIGKLEEKF